jgi:glutamine amidotransferase
MCRHLGYVGAPIRLGALLVDPTHSLVEQSWAPRRQHHGVVNVDGFGVGWYVDGDPVPARHRAAGPIWADETFADLARVVTSRAVLAAVRSATAGMPGGVAAAAPMRHGRWLFSYNGALDGWPKAAGALAAWLPPERLIQLDAPTDTALLWALTTERLDRGATLAEALAGVVAEAARAGGGRLNLLLTDGTALAATAWGASLVWRATASGIVVASEPDGDDDDWHEVPDRHLVAADARAARVTPL